MLPVYSISHLYIYPIKGLSGVSLKESYVTTRGLKHDRRWMLIDENNQFISQRSFPNLCLFKIKLDEASFVISYHANKISVPLEINNGKNIAVKIWNDEVDALLADDFINEFFSEQLRINCRLVFMPANTFRAVDENFVSKQTPVSFADGYPILLIGQESLNLLNTKLDEPVAMDRFRPNIVFNGGEAHAEDLMEKFNISYVELQGVKCCARCQVPGINQQTGIASKEPTRTLSTYRNFDHKINFGQNVIVLNEGLISVNDKIILKV